MTSPDPDIIVELAEVLAFFTKRILLSAKNENKSEVNFSLSLIKVLKLVITAALSSLSFGRSKFRRVLTY
jgi:hypothetical protein